MGETPRLSCALNYAMMMLLLLQLLGDLSVAKGEYLHKNFTNDNVNNTTPVPAMKRVLTTEENDKKEAYFISFTKHEHFPTPR
ncbi:hypothetical protein SK128_016960 [Halocaridina rubra]|uniref:Secreted protein n=1 Tax=Halocaridina rubra TaxID=373956 RepID=A0AAN8ZT54_HALRR